MSASELTVILQAILLKLTLKIAAFFGMGKGKPATGVAIGVKLAY